MLSDREIEALPTLPEPLTVRLRFVKTGPLQYISHLDLQRTFGRILSRARLPLWYTQGFNPHPKLVFALPLSIGCESECELADVKLVKKLPAEEIRERMCRASVPNLTFTGCTFPERKFSDIAFASYRITFPAREGADADGINRFLASSPIIMTKRTKSGEKETDISALIKSAAAVRDGDCFIIDAVLAASEGNTLNPELLLGALRRAFSIPDPEDDVRILRRGLLDAGLNRFE